MDYVTEKVNTVVCPHCGLKYMEPWLFHHDEGEVVCSQCNKKFLYKREKIVVYTTWRPK